MAKSVNFLSEQGFSSIEQLETAMQQALDNQSAASYSLKALEKQITANKVLMGHIAAYGRYKNVYLTNAEIQELQAEFPADYSGYLEKLSQYIASSGKKYQSHVATIRYWITTDQAKSGKKQTGIPDYSYKEGESL